MKAEIKDEEEREAKKKEKEITFEIQYYKQVMLAM